MESTRGRWLGIGARLLATLFFLWLLLTVNRCSPTTEQPDATPAGSPPVPAGGHAELARLQIEVGPEGAAVQVDGQVAGKTPIVLELMPGRHIVRVEQAGFEPLEQELFLAGSEVATLRAELLPEPEPATIAPAGPDQVTWPDLIVNRVQIELESAGGCDYTSTQLGTRVVVENAGDGQAGPFAVEVNGSRSVVPGGLAAGGVASLWVPGYAVGSETVVVVDVGLQVAEGNEDNNRYAQLVPIPTLPPPCTEEPAEPPTQSPPTATPRPSTPAVRAEPVTVREGQVTIPTYPFADHTSQGWNETYKIAYPVLDRGTYDASGPVAVDVSYRTIVLENEYLLLTFLPEFGGRLYEIIYKPTGHRETYRNPVLKPSPWGPREQGWWLAAGGMEWCLPVEEHGYEWGVPWLADISQDAMGATVILRDTEAGDRLRAEIAVRLEASTSAFSIRHRLENPTGAPLAVKYWSNAMLAPGGMNKPSADLRFVLPEAVTAVTVHSRGDEMLPAYDQRMPWPVVDGKDMSRLGNWNRWLGFFEDPAVGGFVAVYDEGYDEGMVRVFPARAAPGTKVFALGWGDAVSSDYWTDDGSSYVELHAGLAPTFDDSVTLPASGGIEWSETWYPVAGLGGLRYGNALAALNLDAEAGEAHIAAATTRQWSGDLVLLLDGQELWRTGVSLAPGKSFREAVSLSGANPPSIGRLGLRLEGPNGQVAAEYSAEFGLE